MAAKARAEKEKVLEDTLRKMPDFNAVIVAADAGAIGGSGASTNSAMTSDFQTETDERSREAKATAQTLKMLAQFFALRHDDILKEFAGADDHNAHTAFLDVDDMRVALVGKMWLFHEMITKKLFPANTKEDAHGRKSAGNHINVILRNFLHTRRACLSQDTYDDPDYAPAPPTKTDFVQQPGRKPAPSATPGKSGEVATPSATDVKVDRKTIASKNAKKDEEEQDTATEKPDGADNAAAKESGALEEDGAETDDNAEAIATEEENERLEQVLREENEKNIRLREELKNLEAIQEMQKKERQKKKRKREKQENVKTIQAKNQEIIDKIDKIQYEINDEADEPADENEIQIFDNGAVSSTKNDAASSPSTVAESCADNAAAPAGNGKKKRRYQIKKHPNAAKVPPPNFPPLGNSGAAGGHASPAAVAVQQIDAAAPNQPDFSRLIHTLELDAVRRNVVGVRPSEPFKQYDVKKQGGYNTLMNIFDSAFGKINGISGNEKVTELSGHWFAGAAKKAINAAKPTVNDPNGDAAYKEIRCHLDSIFAHDVDSAADALNRLKEGGAIARDSLIAHQDLYMNMLEAQSSALTVSSAELFDRRSSLLEIISARIPFYAEKFFEEYEQGDGFQKLLDFVLTRINLLKIIQMSIEPETTQTEAERIKHQHHLHATDHQTQPQYEQTKSCMYCKNRHDTSKCDRLYCLSLEDRVAVISTLHLCYHCLRPGHNARSCPEKGEVTCSICSRKGHVTLLHGRHLLRSPNDSPNRHRRNDSDDACDDAKSDVEELESNETKDENELL